MPQRGSAVPKQTATNARKREVAAKLGVKFNDLEKIGKNKWAIKKKVLKSRQKTAPVNGAAAPDSAEGIQIIPLDALPHAPQPQPKRGRPRKTVAPMPASNDLAVILGQCLLEVLRRR